jgi:hypothetical protein
MASIEIIRGDDKTFSVTVRKNGEVVNLTGYTVFFTVKPNFKMSDDTEAFISKTYSNIPNPALGKFSIVLSSSDTKDLPGGEFWYDIQIKSPTGTISSSLKDRFIIRWDITRRES